MAKRREPNEGPTSGNPSNIKLESVRPLWLDVSEEERYLLLEDGETGDVLMPLIYMKALLEANYSRKLASLKNRLVSVPKGSPLATQEGLLYWQWAFESPHSVKIVVRKELGEENTPQGHLRLVILPIVYNALSQKHDLRRTPLFKALHRVMKQSTYYSLLVHPPSDVLEEVEEEEGLPPLAVQPLFHGPRTLEACALKYMFVFKDQDEVEASKRMRSGNVPTQEEGSLAVREILQQAAASAGANGSGFSLTPGTGPGLVGAGAAGAVASAPVGGGAEVASAYHPLSRAGLGQQAQQHAGAMPTLRELSVPLLPPPPVAPPGAGGPPQHQAQGPGLAQKPAQQQGPEQGHATGAADHTEQTHAMKLAMLQLLHRQRQMERQQQQQSATGQQQAQQPQLQHQGSRHLFAGPMEGAGGAGAGGGLSYEAVQRLIEDRTQHLADEVALLKRCLVQLYGVLIPGAAPLLEGLLGSGAAGPGSAQLLNLLPEALAQQAGALPGAAAPASLDALAEALGLGKQQAPGGLATGRPRAGTAALDAAPPGLCHQTGYYGGGLNWGAQHPREAAVLWQQAQQQYPQLVPSPAAATQLEQTARLHAAAQQPAALRTLQSEPLRARRRGAGLAATVSSGGVVQPTAQWAQAAVQQGRQRQGSGSSIEERGSAPEPMELDSQQQQHAQQAQQQQQHYSPAAAGRSAFRSHFSAPPTASARVLSALRGARQGDDAVLTALAELRGAPAQQAQQAAQQQSLSSGKGPSAPAEAGEAAQQWPLPAAPARPAAGAAKGASGAAAGAAAAAAAAPAAAAPPEEDTVTGNTTETEGAQGAAGTAADAAAADAVTSGAAARAATPAAELAEGPGRSQDARPAAPAVEAPQPAPAAAQTGQEVGPAAHHFADPLESLNIMLQHLVTESLPSLGLAGKSSQELSATLADLQRLDSTALVELITQLSNQPPSAAAMHHHMNPPQQARAQQAQQAPLLRQQGSGFSPYNPPGSAAGGGRAGVQPPPPRQHGAARQPAATANKVSARGPGAADPAGDPASAAAQLALRLAELSQAAPPHPFQAGPQLPHLYQLPVPPPHPFQAHPQHPF